ncbi:MAG: amidase family protein [Gammaproteobacteria bacterium]|nr:amidase family protein [Gammaproteobacteria bacterium]
MNELCFASAVDLSARIRRKDLSPIELAESILQWIDEHDGRVNAFSHLAGDLALDTARQAEREVMAGTPLGPLHGVPVTIKDLHELADYPFEQGSLCKADTIGDTDCPVAARLKAAGAVVLGKTTTSEFGWCGVSRSPLTGITHNPWKHGFNAGASSAGAGAAAAAGFGPLHQGSDGAGSIRMPSHFCGVLGFKPTWGLVPHVPVRNNDQVSHIGPISRTVADAALFLNTTAGAHPFDHTSLIAPGAGFLQDLDGDVADLRIAFSPDLGHARVDAEVAGLVEAAVGLFEDFDCTVEFVAPSWGPDGPEIGRFFWAVHESPLAVHLEEWEAEMDPGLVACIRAGCGHSAETYLAMRARKLAYVEQMHRFMADWDLLLTPSVSVAAFPANRLQPAHWPQHPWDWLSWSEFCYPFNMAGLPAASVPCGFTSEGLPVGMQIVGRRAADHLVLRAAATFERAKPWTHRRPIS